MRLQLRERCRTWAKLSGDFVVLNVPVPSPVLQAKHLMQMINFKFSAPRYLTNGHVVPQFCGVYKSLSLMRLRTAMTARCIAFALGVATSCGASAADRSHCAADEKLVWACYAREKSYALCASRTLSSDGGYLQYRAGRQGRPNFFYPKTLRHPKGAFSYELRNRSALLKFQNERYMYEIEEPLIGMGRVVTQKKNGQQASNFQCLNATGTLTDTETIKLFDLAGIRQ